MTALSLATIEQLAPDQASLNAARGLLNRSRWPLLGRDAAGAVIWGECQGSGSTPYRAVMAPADLACRCSCPSRKQPCKHALALGWLQVQSPDAFAVGDVPPWAVEWLLRRKPKPAGARPAPEGPRPSIAGTAAREAGDAARDSQDETRAAALRERNQQAREAAVAAGLDELDRWILDQLERGLAGFATVAPAQCRLAAQRLTDAKAPGLAARLDELPAQLFALPEEERAEALLQALGGLHLLAEAYRRQDRLPPGLRADVRQLVGWTTSREALLGDPAARRSKGRFTVAATRSEVQPDRLRRIETWLMRADGDAGPDASPDDPAFALLLDFVPMGSATAVSPFSPGESFAAELVFYPSAAPLRALIAARDGAPDGHEAPWPAVLPALDQALDGCDRRLAEQPWLGTSPLAVRDVQVVEDGRGALWLADEGATAGLPIAGAQHELAAPLGLAGRIDAFGLWDGRALELHLARTPLGPWQAG